MGSVARFARIIHLPLALVFHLTGSPFGTESSRAAVLLDDASSTLHLGLLRGYLGVGGHGHHHVGGVHLKPDLGPAGNPRVKILENSVRVVTSTEPGLSVKLSRRRLHCT